MPVLHLGMQKFDNNNELDLKKDIEGQCVGKDKGIGHKRHEQVERKRRVCYQAHRKDSESIRDAFIKLYLKRIILHQS